LRGSSAARGRPAAERPSPTVTRASQAAADLWSLPPSNRRRQRLTLLLDPSDAARFVTDD
jgi:hypothetical protein